MNRPGTTELTKTLNSIKSEKNLAEYLEMISAAGFPETLSGYFEYMFKEKGLVKSDVIAASALNTIYAYQILDGTKNPGREKIIALCIGAAFTLEETQRALEIARSGILYSKDTRDSVIIYAINKKMSIQKTNLLLERYDEKPLE